MSDEELIARLRSDHPDYLTIAAADRIEALTAKIEELRGMRRDDALELLAAHGQAQEAYAAQIAAEVEAAALRAKVARMDGAADKFFAAFQTRLGGEDSMSYIEKDLLKEYLSARAALTDGAADE